MCCHPTPAETHRAQADDQQRKRGRQRQRLPGVALDVEQVDDRAKAAAELAADDGKVGQQEGLAPYAYC